MLLPALLALTLPMTTPLEVHGHRGARARFPENTLPAFRHAIEAGADVLELDLQVSADDHLVVSHDPLISRELCLDPDGRRISSDVPIRSKTWAELSRYDCGSLPNPRFPEQRALPKTPMPAFEEVLGLVKEAEKKGRIVGLNVELKSIPGRPELGVTPERFAALAKAAIASAGLMKRTVVQSFDHRTLKALHAIAPEIRTAVLIEDTLPDLVAVARAASASIVSPNQWWITKEAVAELHAAGLRVVPWTANGKAEWRRLIEMGVDGIITDDPAGLLTEVGRPPK